MDPARASNMLQRLSQAFPAIQELILVCAWLAGLMLVGIGLARLALNRRPETGAGRAVLCMLSGSLLLALPASMASVTNSLFANADPRRILSAVNPGERPPQILLLVVIDFMTLIGWIAGARGLYLISRAGSVSNQDCLARGFAHLFGGVCLVNMLPLAQAIGLQLGIDAQVSQIIGGT